jgi:cobalt-zinc-cadmium efflux system outer membrane protein
VRLPLLSIALLLATACARSPHDRVWLSRAITARTDTSLRPAGGDTASRLPPGATLADGLTEDEAAAIALWNNPAFQADLAQLGFARADLAEAGMLPNPVLALLLPIGPRQVESWLAWPIEVLWQRPRRVEAARLDVARVAHGLVQSGLDVVRDARLAHADAVLAEARAARRAAVADALRAIVQLSLRRATAGDLAEPEVAALRLEAGLAAEAATRAAAERVAVRARLALALGSAELLREVPVTAAAVSADEPAPLEGLITAALAARPDLRAAEIAVEAAGARAGWERSRIFGVVARADVFGLGADATGRAGLQVTLPIFQQNQGGIERAEAEAERALWRLAQARLQVAAEVTAARAVVAQSRAALALWQRDVAPAADDAERGARQAFDRGDTAYLAVLDATRRALDARLREAELTADARRAEAQLTRALGGRHDS